MRAFRVILIAVSVAVLAQQPPLQAAMENAVQRAEPGWKCNHVILSIPLDPHQKPLFGETWERTLSSGQQEDVLLIVVQADSLEEARRDFDLRFRRGNLAAGWNSERINIGEDGHISTYKDGKGVGIDFRKGSIMVHINGRSHRQMAQRLAELVDRVAP